MQFSTTARHIALLSLISMLGACATRVPRKALELSPDTLERRQLETRRFETSDERKLLTACAGFLQDQGYAIEDSEIKLGVIVASKDRDATETGQVIVGVLFGAPWDSHEKIRASVVTRRSAERPGSLVRITFQRVVWNSQNQVSRLEAITDPEIYRQVFQHLSQAVFLEAHQI